MEKLVIISILFTFYVHAHQKEDHSKHGKENKTNDSKIRQISKDYEQKVSSIFKNKCMDCHGEPKKIPWYYTMPIAQQIMNDDMKNAKIHLEIRGGFPFKGHGTPEQDLRAILKVIEENKMPPLRYKLMHWSSKITDIDAEIIKKWVNESLILLVEKKE